MGGIAVALLLAILLALPSTAEPIRVGILKVGASGPLYLAADLGYFAAEGLEAELVNFEAGGAVAVAVEAGNLDVAATGLTASLYNLAAKGDLKILSGLHREAPGFHELGHFASGRAYAAGLTSLRDLPGHSFAITTIGSTTHYALGLIADKYGFAIESVRVLPLQSISNSVSAVAGGEADAGLVPSLFTLKVEAAGAHLLGWVGDETPWQIGCVFTTSRAAAERRDTLERFLRAVQKGARRFHDAVTGPGETRADGPDAPQVFAILAKYLGQPQERLAREIPYVDPTIRIDAADVARQIAWYKAHGMIKGEVSAATLIDRRFGYQK